MAKFPKTVRELRDYIKSKISKEAWAEAVKSAGGPYEAIYWFVANREAVNVHVNMDHRDLANTLLEGTKPIDAEYVKWWLTTFSNDDPDLTDAQNEEQALINFHEEEIEAHFC